MFYRPSLRRCHPALSLRSNRRKSSKREQALSDTSQCEMISYQRRNNAKGDVIKVVFVMRKTVVGRGKRPVIKQKTDNRFLFVWLSLNISRST